MSAVSLPNLSNLVTKTTGSVASIVKEFEIGYNNPKNIQIPYHISPKLLKYFRGFCSSPEIIMLFVYMKCRFSLSYRDLEEIASMRGAKIDHATLAKMGNKVCAANRYGGKET